MASARRIRDDLGRASDSASDSEKLCDRFFFFISNKPRESLVVKAKSGLCLRGGY